MSIKGRDIVGHEGQIPHLGLYRWGDKWGVYWVGLGVRVTLGPLFITRVQKMRR